MKFTTSYLVLAATATNAAHMPAQRDTNEANTMMNNVLQGMKNLDASVNKYQGGNGTDFKASAKSMITTIGDAKKTASRTGQLSATDLDDFQNTAHSLNIEGSNLMAALKNKIPLFQQSCICPTVLSSITTIGDDVDSLMTTFQDGLPGGLPGDGANARESMGHFFSQMKRDLSACTGSGCGMNSTVSLVGSNGTVTAPSPSSPSHNSKVGGSDGDDELSSAASVGISAGALTIAFVALVI